MMMLSRLHFAEEKHNHLVKLHIHDFLLTINYDYTGDISWITTEYFNVPNSFRAL